MAPTPFDTWVFIKTQKWRESGNSALWRMRLSLESHSRHILDTLRDPSPSCICRSRDDREMSRGQASPHGEVAGEEVAGEVGPALSRRRLPALADLVEPA
eukprot:scaffold26054_cov55-Phaeocystis_antarctica.AAC.1